MLFVLEIQGAPQCVTGRLQRILLEIRPGTFVGNVSSKIAKSIWLTIKEHECSAIAVFQANNEMGFAIESHGGNRRSPIDNYGISLVSYKKTKKPVKK